jgi:hypothetical protein
MGRQRVRAGQVTGMASNRHGRCNAIVTVIG